MCCNWISESFIKLSRSFQCKFAILIEFLLDRLNFLHESRNFYFSPANGDGKNPEILGKTPSLPPEKWQQISRRVSFCRACMTAATRSERASLKPEGETRGKKSLQKSARHNIVINLMCINLWLDSNNAVDVRCGSDWTMRKNVCWCQPSTAIGNAKQGNATSTDMLPTRVRKGRVEFNFQFRMNRRTVPLCFFCFRSHSPKKNVNFAHMRHPPPRFSTLF